MNEDMIVISLNPALDKTFVLDAFAEGKTNIIKETITIPGGKGVNVSLALKVLGIEVLITGIIAGEGGNAIRKHLNEKGIREAFLCVPGETRTNYKIYSGMTGITTEMNEKGCTVTEKNYNDFLGSIKGKLNGCGMLVLSGSLPPGVPPDTYGSIINMARDKNIKVILDTNGTTLRDSIDSIPYAIKPNKDEFEIYAGRKFGSVGEIADEMKNVIKKGVSYCIVSMGSEGAVISSGKRTIYARSFDISPKSSVGAGDSMIAAFVYCIVKGMDISYTARFITAYSTICASLGQGLYSSVKEAVKAMEKIKIKEF